MARRALIRASVQGAAPLARDLDRAGRRLQDVLIRRMRRLAARGEVILKERAPHDSGDLAERGLRAVFDTRTRRPTVNFVAESIPGHPGAEDGFIYVDVTRFGHRQSRITPKHSRALSIHGPGRREVIDTRFSVRGFGHGTAKQPHDWVRDAYRKIDREGEEVLNRLGIDIDTVLLPSHRVRR